MTSLIPMSTPQIYSHLSNTKVYKKKVHVCENNLEQEIHTNDDFSIFSCILKKSGLEIFKKNYNFTLFVPSNSSLEGLIDYNNIDRSTAIQIVLSSTLKDKIPSELLESTSFSYYKTLNKIQKLIISSDKDLNLYINSNSPKCIKVIKKNLEFCDGIIHVIDGLIVPYII